MAYEGLEWFAAIDGTFIKEYPQISYTQGRLAKVPILLGSNTDEGTSFGTTGTNTDEDCINQLICAFFSEAYSQGVTDNDSLETLGPHPRRSHAPSHVLPQRPCPGMSLRLGERDMAEPGSDVQTVRVDGRRSDHGRTKTAACGEHGQVHKAGLLLSMGRASPEHE